jgi:hypothetical protein
VAIAVAVPAVEVAPVGQFDEKGCHQIARCCRLMAPAYRIQTPPNMSVAFFESSYTSSPASKA